MKLLSIISIIKRKELDIRETMDTAITLKSLPNLDFCVLSALHLFSREKLPELDLGNYKRPLVVGSGNAAITGKIILQDKDAVFADESNYQEKVKNISAIDGAILISASGGKHAPLIAQHLQQQKIETRLLTNNQNAPAEFFCAQTYVFPKLPEPYTYNTSTYLGMILAKTKESPQAIISYLQQIKKKIPSNLDQYNAFFIIVPEEFDLLREMFLTKFHELFGPLISARVCTPEQTKHAKTVIPSPTELFISLGYDNKLFGKNRINLPLPEEADFATVMAAGYYLIGQIQKQRPPYFKDNIERYAKETSKMFGQEIKPIVE